MNFVPKQKNNKWPGQSLMLSPLVHHGDRPTAATRATLNNSYNDDIQPVAGMIWKHIYAVFLIQRFTVRNFLRSEASH